MLKHIIIYFLLCLACLPIMADSAQFLTINGKSNTRVTFALSDEPKISFKDGAMHIVSKLMVFSLNLSEIINYTFSKDPSSIDEISADNDFKLVNGCILFNGLVAGSKIYTYLQDGRLLNECTADNNGNANVDLKSLPKGIVILRSNKMSIKISNK